MVITQTQFNASMAEINASFMALTKRVEKLEAEKAVKPTTTKDKK